MAKKSSSAEKRHRKSEERRLRNKKAKTAVKTSIKKFTAIAQKKDAGSKEAAIAAFREMTKKLDTAARKRIISKNSAARKKSRMQIYFNTIYSA